MSILRLLNFFILLILFNSMFQSAGCKKPKYRNNIIMDFNNYQLNNIIASVNIDGFWGFINLKGEIKISAKYSEYKKFSKGVAVVKSNTKKLFGLINRKGEWIVKPIYDYLSYFSDGLALAENNEVPYNYPWKSNKTICEWNSNNTFIDRKGKIYEFNKFDDVSKFKNGLAIARIRNRFGFINKKGRTVIPIKFLGVNEFSEGLALVDVGEETDEKGDRVWKFGFINKKGRFIIKPQYDFAFDFHNGIAIVLKDGKSGAIDKNGLLIVPFNYHFRLNLIWNAFKYGVAFACDYNEYNTGNDKIGMINKKGKWIIKHAFDSVSDFSEGLAGVEINGKWGYIDTKGKIVIEPRYERKYADLGNFVNNRAIVRLNGKYGIIDKSGKNLTEFKYDMIWKFKNGLAIVEYDGLFGYLDRFGREVISCEYEDAQYFNYELAAVKYNGKYGYINNKGNVVIPFMFEKAGEFHDINQN